MNFSELCHLFPSLRGYAADARSIARHERSPWYARWIGGCAHLTRDLHRLAEQHDLDFRQVHKIVVGALLAEYGLERAKRQREAARR